MYKNPNWVKQINTNTNLYWCKSIDFTKKSFLDDYVNIQKSLTGSTARRFFYIEYITDIFCCKILIEMSVYYTRIIITLLRSKYIRTNIYLLYYSCFLINTWIFNDNLGIFITILLKIDNLILNDQIVVWCYMSVYCYWTFVFWSLVKQ